MTQGLAFTLDRRYALAYNVAMPPVLWAHKVLVQSDEAKFFLHNFLFKRKNESFFLGFPKYELYNKSFLFVGIGINTVIYTSFTSKGLDTCWEEGRVTGCDNKGWHPSIRGITNMHYPVHIVCGYSKQCSYTTLYKNIVYSRLYRQSCWLEDLYRAVNLLWKLAMYCWRGIAVIRFRKLSSMHALRCK